MYLIPRLIAIVLIFGLVQQTVAAPYRSPLANHKRATPDPSAARTEAELEAEQEANAKIKEEAAEFLRGAAGDLLLDQLDRLLRPPQ